GCFDTNSDINNIMYRSFQQNPFRFLSLYHGFDTSTLEEEADMAAAPGSGGKESGRPKRASRAA
ncbi:MAG TPA: hypothetical protein VHC71_07785, partial [Hyphomicrobium sp.]|nr:hypothetical protein [Hyphomicrobium sp.]